MDSQIPAFWLSGGQPEKSLMSTPEINGKHIL